MVAEAIPGGSQFVFASSKERVTRGHGDLGDRNYKLFAAAMVLIALIVTIVYGGVAAPKGAWLRSVTAAGLAAAAAFAIGGFIGFLFGIPKTLQGEPTEGRANGRHRSWQANTNLEQISDWLTKILLGIGLTQLTSLPAEVQATGEYVAESIGPAASGVVGSTILVVFTIAGFVIGFLITRFDLGKAIDREDGVIEALAFAVMQTPNDRSAVEALVVTSLYAPEPGGFEQAIQACEAFLNRAERPASPTDDARFHGYLACAYAQKFRFEQGAKASREQLDALRAKVLVHLRIAIEHDPGSKSYFRQLANPPVGSGEDDLAVFKDDPEFLQLLA